MVLTNLYFLVFQVSPNETSGCCDTVSNPGYIDKATDSHTHKISKTSKNQEAESSCNLLFVLKHYIKCLAVVVAAI